MVLLGMGWVLSSGSQSSGQEFIPRKQTKPPGPALSPEEALSRMEVPEGFRVELVASEPQLMNPVAMAFDDAGRIYVTGKGFCGGIEYSFGDCGRAWWGLGG